jgi:hypothetical protein
MICIASIEGRLIFFAVFAIVAAINWFFEKKKRDGASDSPPPETPRQSDTGAGNDSEQERLRRFLEALGVPQPQQSQPQRPTPAPSQQSPRPVVRVIERQMRAAQPVVRPALKIIRQPKAPVIAPQAEMPRAGRIEEAASSIERISGEFGTMNVQVAMPPVQTLERSTRMATANAGTTSVLEREGNPLVASLRRTLTNPTDIRAAFLAAELLGPPRSLQS